jgi:hypothetical protein
MLYAGVGSRETPPEILSLMTQLAVRLGQLGFTLCSGGAKGADTAFERGVLGTQFPARIYYTKGCGYLKGFDKEMYSYSEEAVKAGLELFEEFHPAPHKCGDYAKLLHMRNAFILLGRELAHEPWPVDFIVCWTKDGNATGGTGQALRIAEAYNIPVFNLFHEDALDRLRGWLLENRIRGVK